MGFSKVKRAELATTTASRAGVVDLKASNSRTACKKFAATC